VCVCVCVCVCGHVCASDLVYVYVRVMPFIACPKTALYPHKKSKKSNISVNYSVPMHAPGVGIFLYKKHMYAMSYVCVYIYEYVHVYIYVKM